jgi:hypothetical protein
MHYEYSCCSAPKASTKLNVTIANTSNTTRNPAILSAKLQRRSAANLTEGGFVESEIRTFQSPEERF